MSIAKWRRVGEAVQRGLLGEGEQRSEAYKTQQAVEVQAQGNSGLGFGGEETCQRVGRDGGVGGEEEDGEVRVEYGGRRVGLAAEFPDLCEDF